MEVEEHKKKEQKEGGLYEHHRFVADPKQTLIRIDKFLMDRIAQISRNRIQNVIKDGAVKVNDKVVKANFRVKPGHVITITLAEPPREKEPILPENIPLDIVYEDDDIIVLNKPVGMAVHPGIGIRSGTLVNALAYHVNGEALPIKEGNDHERPGLVHRIDKNTSGLLVVAKNNDAMTHLSKQFFDHTIERKYVAIIWGEFEEDEGTIEGNIGRHPSKRTIQTVFPEGEEGKHAITHFKVLERLYYISVVECQLETGRTHQIRVHMKHKGHPIFNDEKYGGDRVVKGTVFDKYRRFVENSFKLIPRQALHAKSLGFVHPKTGEKMYFESEMPEDFQAVMSRWRTYLGGRKELL